jgi:hypothetical protein
MEVENRRFGGELRHFSAAIHLQKTLSPLPLREGPRVGWIHRAGVMGRLARSPACASPRATNTSSAPSP